MLDLNSVPYALAVILVILCLGYTLLVTFLLIRDAINHRTNRIIVLHRLQRYCKSLPRTDAIPIPALEKLLDAIDRADVDVDIDQIVIDALFKTSKNKGTPCT